MISTLTSNLQNMKSAIARGLCVVGGVFLKGRRTIRACFVYWRLSAEERALAREVWCALAYARYGLLCRPFDQLSNSLGIHMCETFRTRVSTDQQVAAQVGKMIRRVAAYCPWQTLCFVQAIAAHRLLSRRGLPVTIYVGVKRGEVADVLNAHAWLRYGSDIITGQLPDLADFTMIATFAQIPGYVPQSAD